jgi:hypothetical protein
MTEGWSPTRRLLAFAALAPFLLGVSYPMLFLYAGLLLAFLPAVWRQRQVGPWVAYVGLAAVVLATFTCLYFGPIRAQRVPGLVEGWMNKFPDPIRPASVPGWVAGNTFLVFHYCYNPIGSCCVLLVALGVWWCRRNHRLDLACVCLGPLAACLLAAFLQAYPYSNNRLILFAAPGIGLLSGLGVSVALGSWRQRTRWVLPGLVAVLLLPEAGLSLLHLQAPWDKHDAVGATRFVAQQRRPGDFVATRGGTYHYFFFGEVLPLEEAARGPGRGGQRVWVLLDHTIIFEDPRAAVLSVFRRPEWELRAETSFHRGSVYLFVRPDRADTRAPDESEVSSLPFSQESSGTLPSSRKARLYFSYKMM